MKGFLGIKLSDKEYSPVLDLGDISVKKILLGKAPDEQNVKLDLYLSSSDDFLNPRPVGSFFLDNLDPDTENIDVYFKIVNEILYVYGESNGIHNKSKFDLSLTKIKDDEMSDSSESNLDDLSLQSDNFEAEKIEDFGDFDNLLDDLILNDNDIKNNESFSDELSDETKKENKNSLDLKDNDFSFENLDDSIKNFNIGNETEEESIPKEDLGNNDFSIVDSENSLPSGESEEKQQIDEDNFDLNIDDGMDSENEDSPYFNSLDSNRTESIQNDIKLDIGDSSVRVDESSFSDIFSDLDNIKINDNIDGESVLETEANQNENNYSYDNVISPTPSEDFSLEHIKLSTFLDDSEDLSVDDIIKDIDKNIISVKGLSKTIERKENNSPYEESKNNAVENIGSSSMKYSMLYFSLLSLLLLIFFSFFLIFYRILKPQDLLSSILVKENQRIERCEKNYYG